MTRIQKSIIFEDVKNYIEHVCDCNTSWSDEYFQAISNTFILGDYNYNQLEWMEEGIIEHFHNNKYWLGSRTCRDSIQHAVLSACDNLSDTVWFAVDSNYISISDLWNCYIRTGHKGIAYRLFDNYYSHQELVDGINMYPRQIISIMKENNCNDDYIAKFIIDEYKYNQYYNIRKSQVDWANKILS